MMKRLALFGLAFLLVAATPPPPTLSPYVHDSKFDPGDYGWMRGAFPEANAADKAAMAGFFDWQTRCMAAEAVRVKAELVAMGIADPKIEPHAYQDDVCGQANMARLDTRAWPSFAAFSADLERARPVVATIGWATHVAEAVAAPEPPSTASLLVARPTGDQMLRSMLSWGSGPYKDAPPLGEGAQAIASRFLWLGIRERDHANTAWLKELIAREGWPRESVVGQASATYAWLLAQHADDDPAFQLRVLRLMEPLLAAHDVRPGNHALLYDRVMLKLAGRQRYGTQMMCTDGDYAPLPLEDPVKVEGYRKDAGMSTIAENTARIRAQSGPCPPVPAGRAPGNK